MEHLYTRGLNEMRHLIYVSDQLARTYDVYGMEMDHILGILPKEFQRWNDTWRLAPLSAFVTEFKNLSRVWSGIVDVTDV